MPFAVLEALVSGLPVAASDIPGQAALGQGLAACRLVPLDPFALADAIAILLDRDEATAAAATEEGILRVREEYDLVPWAQRLLDVYDELEPARSSS
jgi:glycosyltransferase involved in cell wall biosynthesis